MTSGDDPTARSPDRSPAAAGLVRDFVNTYEPQLDLEGLPTPAALHTWSVARGLLPVDACLGPGDLDLVRRVREGFRAVLVGHAGHPVAAAAVDGLNQALAVVPVRVGFGADAEPRLSAVEAGGAEVVCALLAAVQTAVRDGTWERLKVCAKDSCRWAYYDASRNRSGRWCSMAGCGNQVKMQRAHATRRHRTRPEAGSIPVRPADRG